MLLLVNKIKFGWIFLNIYLLYYDIIVYYFKLILDFYGNSVCEILYVLDIFSLMSYGLMNYFLELKIFKFFFLRLNWLSS